MIILCAGKDKDKTKILLEKDFQTVANWFYENAMILNPDKCHFMCLGKDVGDEEEFNSLSYKLQNNNEEKMLGITIDRKLNFESHINSLCRKSSQKLSALNRVAPYLGTDKRKFLFNSIIKSYSYCPLVWMFSSRKSNNIINRIHERALRLSFEDKESAFHILLEKCNEITIHQRNI